MIITKTGETVTGSITALKTEGFKIANTAHMMDILSKKLYNNPELAVCRELVCNAIDAEVAAGNPQPVEVTLPDWTNDFRFVVKDFGTGMSEEDVMTLYTTYGASTKQSSNDFIGCLGIGSKSPFAVTEEFSVVSRYQGTATTYHCYKQEGLPVCTKLSSAKTDEHDGMTITVPFTQHTADNFNKHARNFFKGVNKELVKIDESFNVKFYEDFKPYVKYSEGNVSIAFIEELFNNYGRECYVRMGQVLYKVPYYWTDSEKIYFRDYTVLEVPIGSFVISANRESLEESKENEEKFKKTIEDLREGYLNKEFRPALSKIKTVRSFRKFDKESSVFNCHSEVEKKAKEIHANTSYYSDASKAWLHRKNGRVMLRDDYCVYNSDEYTVIVPDVEPVTQLGSLIKAWSRNDKDSTYAILEKKTGGYANLKFAYNTVFVSQLNAYYEMLKAQEKRRRKTAKKVVNKEVFTVYRLGSSADIRYKKTSKELEDMQEIPYIVLKELVPIDKEDNVRVEEMNNYRKDCYAVSLGNSKGLPDNYIPLKDYLEEHRQEFDDIVYKEKRMLSITELKKYSKSHCYYVPSGVREFLGNESWLWYTHFTDSIRYAPKTYGDRLLSKLIEKEKRFQKFLTEVQTWFRIEGYNKAPKEIQQLIMKLYTDMVVSDESTTNVS